MSILDEMRKDTDDFFRASDRFIRKQKEKMHETCTCAHCGTIIEPDEPMKFADDMPFHRDCFRAFMRGE